MLYNLSCRPGPTPDAVQCTLDVFYHRLRILKVYIFYDAYADLVSTVKHITVETGLKINSHRKSGT